MSTEEVLNQIDSAIADWEVGPDAMRCNAYRPGTRVPRDPGAFEESRGAAGFIVPSVADPAAPTMAELQAGIPISCTFTLDGMSLLGEGINQQVDDTGAPPPVCGAWPVFEVEYVQVPGTYAYGPGGLTFTRDLDYLPDRPGLLARIRARLITRIRRRS